jgi:hypothetical protein
MWTAVVATDGAGSDFVQAYAEAIFWGDASALRKYTRYELGSATCVVGRTRLRDDSHLRMACIRMKEAIAMADSITPVVILGCATNAEGGVL